jgi:hypothetical protein
MQEQAIATEVAQAEFQRFAKAWDIETDTKDMDVESREDFEKLSRTIVRAIEHGRASVNDDNGVDYQLSTPVGEIDSLTFRVPRGVDYMAMDTYKERETSRKMFAFMASTTKQSVKFFGSLSGADIKFAQAVTTLFMAS